MGGFVGPTAADPTPWLALQIGLPVLDGLCNRASLLVIHMLAQFHEQAYEVAAPRELQLQEHFHEPVISSSAAAWILKAQLQSSILALALWLLEMLPIPPPSLQENLTFQLLE